MKNITTATRKDIEQLLPEDVTPTFKDNALHSLTFQSGLEIRADYGWTCTMPTPPPMLEAYRVTGHLEEFPEAYVDTLVSDSYTAKRLAERMVKGTVEEVQVPLDTFTQKETA